MKKNIELLMAKQFADLAVSNLDAAMRDDCLSDKEFNAIREAHDSIASARDAVERLTKPQRMVSAEAKESGYGEPEDEKIRQELIKVATLAFRRGDTLFGEKWDYMKWITWLKKQGCQKPFNYECANIPQKDFSPSIGIEIPFGAKDSELQEATYLIPEGFHAEIKDDEVLVKKGKQMPAWSEEDKEMRMKVLKYISTRCNVFEYEEVECWLQSIKQRIGG